MIRIYLTVLSALGLARLLVWAIYGIPLPWDTSVPEGSGVQWVYAWMQNGGSLYADASVPPYAPVLYTPFYYSILRGILELTGAGVPSHETIYFVGRVLGWSAIVVTALVLTRLAGSWRYAGWLLLIPTVMHFGTSVRPDLPALAFTAVGLLIFERRRKGWLLWTAVFLVAAFYTKQSWVSAPLWVVWRLFGDPACRREARGFSLIFGGGLLLIGALLQVSSEGQFLEQAFFAHRVGADFAQFPGFLFYGLIAYAIPGAVLFWSRSAFRDPVSIYFLLSAAVALVLGLKAGSYGNYFIEAFFALGWWMARALKSEPHSRVDPRFRVLISALVLGAVLWKFERAEWFELRKNPRVWLERVERLRSMPGDLLTSDAGIALRHGGTLWVTDFYETFSLIGQGHLDPSRIEEALSQGLIRKILIFRTLSPAGPHPIWPDSLRATVLAHFELAESEQGYELWLPRPKHVP